MQQYGFSGSDGRSPSGPPFFPEDFLERLFGEKSGNKAGGTMSSFFMINKCSFNSAVGIKLSILLLLN